MLSQLLSASSSGYLSVLVLLREISNDMAYFKTHSLRMALTTALEKGADVVVEVIVEARLSVAANIQKTRMRFVTETEDECPRHAASIQT